MAKMAPGGPAAAMMGGKKNQACVARQTMTETKFYIPSLKNDQN